MSGIGDMWLLQGERQLDGQAFYLQEGTFIIGRAAPNIAIALAVRHRHHLLQASIFN